QREPERTRRPHGRQRPSRTPRWQTSMPCEAPLSGVGGDAEHPAGDRTGDAVHDGATRLLVGTQAVAGLHRPNSATSHRAVVAGHTDRDALPLVEGGLELPLPLLVSLGDRTPHTISD